MDSTKRVIKFQNYDLKKSVGMFWLVLGLGNILFYALNVYSNPNVRIGMFKNGTKLISIVGSNIMAIVIFFIVYGILMYHEDFTLALSFGITRNDFYKSVIVNNILVALIFGIIQGTLQVVDKYIVEYLGYKAMMDFGIFNTSTDNVFSIILSLTILFLTIVSITNLLGVLQFRLGYTLWVFIGIMLLLGPGVFITGLVTRIFECISFLLMGGTILRTLTQIGIIGICYILGYILIKRTNIKK